MSAWAPEARLRQEALSGAWRRVAWASLFALAATCVASGATAEPTLTADEARALASLRAERLAEARTAAEAILRTSPGSLVAHYVLGSVLYEADGVLPRALHHLGRAREIYETRWSPSSRSVDAPWELHRDLLFAVQNVAGQMELHEYQLDVLGYHDFLYEPDLLAERAWPLLRLGRVREARRVAELASAAADPLVRLRGLNARCAVEGEAGAREAYFVACRQAFSLAEAERAHGAAVQVAVHGYNAALAAVATGRRGEAERILGAVARRLEFTTANPWRLLLRLHLDAGRLVDAVEALREMKRWRTRQPAYLRDQDRAETDVALATLLLVVGEPARGLEAVERAVEAPDRRGSTSSLPGQARGAHALLARALRRTLAEVEREDAAARGLWSWWTAQPYGWVRRAEAAIDASRARASAAEGERLVATLRFGVRGGMEPVPEWLVGDLVHVVGPAAVRDALARAERADAPQGLGWGEREAIRAELAWVEGRYERTQRHAERALAKLGPGSALLRARVAAVAGAAALEAGLERTGATHLEAALRVDGGVVRRLGIALPATFDVSGDGAVRAAASALERSPRFTDGRGFRVRVSGSGRELRACLHGPNGDRIGCAEAVRRDGAGASPGGPAPSKPVPPESEDAFVARFAAAFHRQVFAPAVALDAIDLGSLDGRVSSGSERARERMEGMLHEFLARDRSAPASPPPPPSE